MLFTRHYTSQTGYIYDGMRVIQERTSLVTPSVAYTRGVDFSGTLEGAGGIGGMLARTHGYSAGNWSTHHFYHADGNGNITYLVNTSQGHGCSYRYTPYGVLLNSANGTLTATANAYRFSSKEFITNPGLYYYGLRFYDPNLQRWINRDPIAELGGINLYRFARNSPLVSFDGLGLAPNQAGTCDPSHVADALSNDPTLGRLRDDHGGNDNRYFYTDDYGWVDIRHFAEAARRAQAGEWGWLTESLGFANEVRQWLSEWGDDYRSGFSPEDLPSNSAGVDFGKSIRPGESLADAFNRWARENGARNQNDPTAGRNRLPTTDPSVRGGNGRGSNTSSGPQRPGDKSKSCT